MRTTNLSFLVMICIGVLHADPVVVSGGPENDYESWIARLHDNRLMLVFCRNPDWVSGDLYVTFSSDSGTTWDSARVIIEDTLNQSTLSFAQMPDDTLWLWYASNETNEYQIYAAFSMDGISWTKQGPVALGWQSWQRHYDPTVILEPDSSLTMSYRGPDGGYIAHHPYGGSWDTLKTRVAPSGYRPRVMKHSSGTYLYAYHRNTGGSYDYDVFIRTSMDRVNWSDSIRLTFNSNSHDPFPNETPDGAYRVFYAKYEAPAYNLHCRRSYDAITWEPEEQITADNSNNTQPHFFYESDEIYLAWAHAVVYPNDHDVYFERLPDLSIHEHGEKIGHGERMQVDVYPNPCTDALALRIISHDQPMSMITFYDVQGRLLFQKQMVPVSRSVCDVSWLPTGTYFLELTTGDGDVIRRFTVMR